MLLREVVATNPFTGNGQKPWDVIAEAMKTYMLDVSAHCCRERCLHLMKMYKENDCANLQKSGIEEQYDEKEQLLQEIIELEEVIYQFNSLTWVSSSDSCMGTEQKQLLTTRSLITLKGVTGD